MYAIEYSQSKYIVVNTKTNETYGIYDSWNDAVVICSGLNIRNYNSSLD